MPLEPEVLRQIDGLVRGGFEDHDRIVEILCEEMYEPGELAEEEVEEAVGDAIEALERDKGTWPAVTDCDKLDKVFDALNKRGIIALQCAGYTQSDGYDDVQQEYEERPGREKLIGYCYYHGQDLERAVHGKGLYLAFGPMDPDKEESEGPRVGAMIVDQLKSAGFTVEWDGTFSDRIYIPRVDWKRRDARQCE
jgi:hypothetical protein